MLASRGRWDTDAESRSLIDLKTQSIVAGGDIFAGGGGDFASHS